MYHLIYAEHMLLIPERETVLILDGRLNVYSWFSRRNACYLFRSSYAWYTDIHTHACMM